MAKDSSTPPPLSGLVGLALIGLTIVGLAYAFFAIAALNKADFTGCGVLFIASAFSFGFILNGLVRK